MKVKTGFYTQTGRFSYCHRRLKGPHTLKEKKKKTIN